MHFSLCIFRKQKVKGKILDRIVAGILEILSATHFLMKCNFEAACLVEFCGGLDHSTAYVFKLHIELISGRGSKARLNGVTS